MATPTLASHPAPSSPVISHFSLQGKTAIVTGGTRGIGLEAAKGLAEAGASVAILYTSTDPVVANETAASIAKSSGQIVKAYRGDVASSEEIASVILSSPAGIATHYAAEDYTVEQWREIMNVNLDGAFYTAQVAGRIFKEQFNATGRQGRLIFTASVSAILVNVPQKQAAYNASKAGVVQLARCLSVEWAGFARVNCVSPGFIATDMLSMHPESFRRKWFDMIPANRMCEPAELKGIYVFLASDASSYMTGANLVVDGGYTLP